MNIKDWLSSSWGEFLEFIRSLRLWRSLSFLSMLAIVAGIYLISVNWIAWQHSDIKSLADVIVEIVKNTSDQQLIITFSALIVGIFLLFTRNVLFSDERISIKRERARFDMLMREVAMLNSQLHQARRAGNSEKIAIEEDKIKNVYEKSQETQINVEKRSVYKAAPAGYLDIFIGFSERMALEEARLRTNSRLNLLWGIVFSGSSLISLAMSIIYAPVSHISGLPDFLIFYGPRMAIPIILELVSFFFLRLYSATEQEIKHHKNEVTNMEARFSSALYAEKFNDEQSRLVVLNGFSSIERNFIIKKGEKSIASEVDSRYNDIVEIIKTINKNKK